MTLEKLIFRILILSWSILRWIGKCPTSFKVEWSPWITSCVGGFDRCKHRSVALNSGRTLRSIIVVSYRQPVPRSSTAASQSLQFLPPCRTSSRRRSPLRQQSDRLRRNSPRPSPERRSRTLPQRLCRPENDAITCGQSWLTPLKIGFTGVLQQLRNTASYFRDQRWATKILELKVPSLQCHEFKANITATIL